MENIFLQYGILGVIAVVLTGYIMKIEKRHRSERSEWKKDMLIQHKEHIEERKEERKETNQVIRDNTNILAGLKTLLEHKI